jgi:hypothetical protein
MSSARRTPQFPVSTIGLIAVAVVLLLIGLKGELRAGTNERIVTDPYTGLAIDGYDPVAYFVDKEARLGMPDREFNFGGAVWRFRNEGNQAAFVAHPDIYAPCFGGYDPVGVARGVTLPGNPQFFAVLGERLCLFYSGAERRKFVADPQKILRAADKRWPEIRATLAQ